MFEQIPFWKDLTESEKNLITNNAVIKKCKKGSAFMSCEDSCFGMFLVVKGNIRVHLISDEGKEISLFKVNPGDCCVISVSCVLHQITFETSLEVEEDSEILLIDSETFKRIFDENINVRCFSYELATVRFSQVMWVLQQIVFSKFDKRLASYLVTKEAETGSGEIETTQEAVAKEINSAREVVTRMLKEFSEAGYVEIKRGKIILKDSDALRHIAEV